MIVDSLKKRCDEIPVIFTIYVYCDFFPAFSIEKQWHQIWIVQLLGFLKGFLYVFQLRHIIETNIGMYWLHLTPDFQYAHKHFLYYIEFVAIVDSIPKSWTRILGQCSLYIRRLCYGYAVSRDPDPNTLYGDFYAPPDLFSNSRAKKGKSSRLGVKTGFKYSWIIFVLDFPYPNFDNMHSRTWSITPSPWA